MLTKLKSFLKDIYIELRKVSWPSRRDIIGSTAVVIILSIIVAIIIGILDFIYARGLVSFITR